MTKTNADRIATALRNASTNPDAWDAGALRDIAERIAEGMPRPEMAVLLAQNADDQDEANRMIDAVTDIL